MEDSGQFEEVFGSDPNLAYSHQTIEKLVHNRKVLEGTLFFDRLLQTLNFKDPSQVYPPKSNLDLRNLFEQIVASDSPDHHIQSLVYYLLQDLQHTKQSAETYARKTFLPNQYETFIDGLWNLDRLYPEKALDNLTSPSLIPTFPEEILYTLCQLSLPSKDSTLPLAYYHTVNPAISSPKVQDAFFSILCRASITEAFYWSRTHDEFLHRRLFEKLIAFVHSDATGQIRSGRAIEMMCLPLGNEEKGWFEDFVTDGKGKTLPGIKDTIIMWKMIVGDKKGLKEMGPALNGKKVDGMTWGTLVDGLT